MVQVRNYSNNFRVNIMTAEEIMKLVTSKDGYIGHAMNIPHDRQNKTHELVLEYNQTSPADIKRGQDLLKQILGTYNEKVVIQHGVHFDFGFNTHFLGMAYVNFGVTFLDTSPITIGDMCFIAPGVILTCAGHPVVAEQRVQCIETSKPITIGNSVWIGAHATICGGVTIGDDAVIGAGAVVLHDVPENTIVAGVPAKEIRKITDKDIIPSDEIFFLAYRKAVR